MAAFVYERIDFVSTKEYSCPSWVRQGKLMRVVRHHDISAKRTEHSIKTGVSKSQCILLKKIVPTRCAYHCNQKELIYHLLCSLRPEALLEIL